MLKELQKHLNQILKTYSVDEYYDHLLKAKTQYFKLTGQANEEDDDYEVRMKCFNDWYIMHYSLDESGKTPLDLYLEKNKLTDEVYHSLSNFRYSLFEYCGKSFGGKPIVRDLLNGEKLAFTKSSSDIPVFKGDLFVGRLLKIEEDFFLMKGICLLPSVAKTLIKRQVKKVKRRTEPGIENVFLIEAEKLKTKWQRFGHVDAARIFVFTLS